MRHRLLVGIIGIGVTILDNLDAVLVHLVEVVTTKGYLVGLDAHESDVLQYDVLEKLFLVARIRIVKTDQKGAIVLLVREVVVEESGLRVTDVQVTAGLKLVK